MENALATNKGEYDSEYTINAGTLLRQGVDGDVDDGVGGQLHQRVAPRLRRRAATARSRWPTCSPTGYRRWLANNLTGDDVLKGARLQTDPTGMPMEDRPGLPRQRHGLHPSGGATTRRVCFPRDQSLQCSTRAGQHGGDRPAGGLGAAEVPHRVDAAVPAREQAAVVAEPARHLGDGRRQRPRLRRIASRCTCPTAASTWRRPSGKETMLRQVGAEGHRAPAFSSGATS